MFGDIQKNGLGMFLQNNRCSNFSVVEKQGILEAVPSRHLCFQGQEESVKKQKQISSIYIPSHTALKEFGQEMFSLLIWVMHYNRNVPNILCS